MVLEEHSLPPRADWEPQCPPTIEGGESAATMLLERYPEISALFCYNDLTAVGALQAAQNLGRRVPEDLSIAGFDGIPLAGLVTPSLTTCEVNTYELGVQAMHLLMAQIAEDPRGYHEITIKPDLVIRESTAACP
jgi:DNA-binding LacI/PurR family transcriptional regulator